MYKTTYNNIGLGNVIEQGRVTRSVRVLEWRACNGIIIPGQSRSGKTNSAVYYMSQYASQGVKLIVCDFNGGLDGTLIPQIDHLAGAFYWEPATDGDQIVEYIERIHDLGKKRYTGKVTNNFPLLFVIDEFTSLLSNNPAPAITTRTRAGDTTTTTKQAGYMQHFVDVLTTAAKRDIKFMVMGQNWAQVGTTSSLRQFRGNFTDAVFHRLSSRDAELFTNDRQTINQIESLRAGFVIHNGDMLRVPLFREQHRLDTERLIRKQFPGFDSNELLGKLLGEVLPDGEAVREAHWKAVEVVPRHSIIRANPPRESTVEVLPKPEAEQQQLPNPLMEIITRIKRGESNYIIAKNMYKVTSGRKYQLLTSGIEKIRRKMNE